MLKTVAPLLLLPVVSAEERRRLVGDSTKAFAVVGEDAHVHLTATEGNDVLVTSAEFEAAEFRVTGSDKRLSAALAELAQLKNDHVETLAKTMNVLNCAELVALPGENSISEQLGDNLDLLPRDAASKERLLIQIASKDWCNEGVAKVPGSNRVHMPMPVDACACRPERARQR